MKKILSTVLALCMILGCVAAGFSAQAAPLGNELQAAINAAIAGDGECNWTGGDVELSKPLTINGNVKINFNGATIKGAAYKHTIIISGGNVELINADIEGIGGHYEGIINPSDNIRGFVDEIGDACPTIYIGGGNVTMTSLVVTGAQVRMIGTGAPHDIPKLEIPASDAITMANANAVLNLNNVRAFGNIGVENLYGSKVNVVDCLVGGYTKDFNDRKNVSFANGTTQYRNMDLVKEALADYVTLTEGEELYMNKFFNHFLQVTASVKNQNYVEPTYSYDAATDTLTVTATADKSYDVQAECAFDYYYIPKTATILGETKNFVKTGALTYTATFENIGGNTVCDTDLVYKLAVGLDGDAQTMIDDALDQLDGFIDSIPSVLDKFNSEIYQFVDKYIDGSQGYATLFYNAYQEFGVDALLGDLNTAIEQADEAINNTTEGTQERADAEAAKQAAIDAKNKAEADIKAFFGPIFDLCGASLKGNAQLNSALAAVANGTASVPQTNDAMRQVTALNDKFGSHLDYTTGANGLLDEFLGYWDDVYALAVQNGEFNDIKGLGEYLGANYLNFYDLLKDLLALAHRLGNMINDSDNYIIQMLGSNDTYKLNGKSITDYVGVVNDALAKADDLFAYADNFLATNSTYNGILNTFGDDVPKYCGIYAEKAFNIVTNIDTYIDIETDGEYVEGFEFPQTATYTTPADAETVTVTVQIHGFGKYSVNGDVYTTTQHFDVPVGGTFTVAPVEMDATLPLFKFFTIGDSNANEKMSQTGGTLTVFNNTIINVTFGWDADVYEVTFMTNYELSSRWLDTINSDEVESNGLPEVPEFEGATFLGWADQNISGVSAQAAGILMTNAQVIDAASNVTENTTFYAIFTFPDSEVSSDLLNNTMTMTDNFASGGKAYFTALFSDRALTNGDTIVEAGIIAAISADNINAATATTGSGIARGKVNLNQYSLPVRYTYKIGVGNMTNVTVYAKGYVIIQHQDGTFDYDYTNVYTVIL